LFIYKIYININLLFSYWNSTEILIIKNYYILVIYNY
jgi:hypothetical protein